MSEEPRNTGTFDPNVGLGLIMTSNRVLEMALWICMTDPAALGCVRKALGDCLLALEKCLEDVEQPPCPDGTKPENGVCKPPGI